MELKPLTQAQVHALNQDRFRKTPLEKEQSKVAKSQWKLAQKSKKK